MEQDRRMGVGRVLGHTIAVRTRHSGINVEPVHGCPRVLHLLDLVVVQRQAQWHFARSHQIGQQGVALAYGHAVPADNVLEQGDAFFFTHFHDNFSKPVAVFGFDRQPALPFGIEQIGIGLGQLFLFDQLGVVGASENVQARSNPLLVGADGLWNQIDQVRRLALLQQFFTRQNLQLRTVGFEDVYFIAFGTRFQQATLQDLFRTAAPHFRLDTITLLKGAGQRANVIHGHRGVDAQLTFFARTFGQFVQAVCACQVGKLCQQSG